MHNVSAIKSAQRFEEPYSFVRSAIIAWYYAIYYSAKSIIAAESGSNPQKHAKVGKIWQTDIIPRNIVVAPFDYNFVDLTPGNIQQTIAAVRGSNPYDLNTTPENREQAVGALISYLKGTAEYERERLEREVKSSSDYKRGGFTNFRSKAARELRDRKLAPAHVNFLVQAFRYRGKANYRDAIYLSYGADNLETLSVFIKDLAEVAGAFTFMAAHFLCRRLTRDNWRDFTDDIRENVRFPLPFELKEL